MELNVSKFFSRIQSYVSRRMGQSHQKQSSVVLRVSTTNYGVLIPLSQPEARQLAFLLDAALSHAIGDIVMELEDGRWWQLTTLQSSSKTIPNSLISDAISKEPSVQSPILRFPKSR
jgi:hypothetical protein